MFISPESFDVWALPYMRRIVTELERDTPKSRSWSSRAAPRTRCPRCERATTC